MSRDEIAGALNELAAICRTLGAEALDRIVGSDVGPRVASATDAELARLLASARGLVAGARRALDLRRSVQDLDEAQIAERLTRAEAAAVERARSSEKKSEQLHEAIGVLRGRVSAQLEGFASTLEQELVAQCAQAEPADLRRYLAPFIADTVQTFARERAEAVAVELKAIAERAAALVADEQSSGSAALGRWLGVPLASFDLKPDTFGFDVAVVALGVVGMTTMFLSSLLTGGLIALAAPVVALVAQERAARETRRRAAEAAPKAIRAAVGKVAGALDERIDDFRGQVRRFVAERGAAVERDAASILRAAQRDGRTARDKLDGAGSQLDAIEAKLKT